MLDLTDGYGNALETGAILPGRRYAEPSPMERGK